MFKRISALVLCIIMMFSMVACSGGDRTLIDVSTTTTRSDNAPMTISLYVPSLSKLTDETREAVEEALNAISIKKYNTTLKFFAYPEEEYVPIVLSKVQTAMNSYITYLTGIDPSYQETESTVDYTKYKDYTLADMTDYPELSGVGIDIFVSFVADEDSIMRQGDATTNQYYNPYMADKLFLAMYDQRVLAPISPRLINDYAILKSKSYTEFFDAVTLVDRDADASNIDTAKSYAYGMPNNYLLGSYQFLIFNKDAVSEIYTQDFSTFVGNPTKLNQLVKDLTALKANGNEKLSKIKNVFVEFESYDDYMAYDGSFAVAMVKGDLGLPYVIANENYEIIQYSASEYNTADLGTSVFCITRAYDKELMASGIDEDARINRCLDILLLIQNDADFRNTLQYGVKGEHYTISRDGTVYTSSNDYVMDPAKTGNMFLLYPSDRMSPSMRKLAENKWVLAKKQNKDYLDSKPTN